ncbi:MAG: aldehyde dehydrogenase family protein, partial [Aquihabitans sp.]
MVDGQHFIDGSWRPARSGATDDVVNPATGAVITAVPSGDAADVDDAVAAAAAAFASWGKTTPRERSEKLLALADAVERDLPELKRLEMENVGKPASIVDFEFDLTVDNIRFFAGAARCLDGAAAGEYLPDHTS